jgi:hypothetical protein
MSSERLGRGARRFRGGSALSPRRAAGENAQWQLGEIFRKGKVYCGVKMELARKYRNMAAEQGHDGASASASASASPSASAKAVARLAEMNRERLHCDFCGADDAPSECELCHRVRYCNLVCSHAHWRHGGGFQSPARGAAEEKHKHTCNRTYERSGE